MENNSEYFIVIADPCIDDGTINLNKVVGKIELFDDKLENAKLANTMLQTGNFRISPFGFEEKDENGYVTKFELKGFNITPK